MNRNELTDLFCRGEGIHLRPLLPTDVGGEYCRWMNTPATTRFLESRFQRHTLESISEFVRRETSRPEVHFLAIIRNADGRHIGNIKLGPVEAAHHLADIGILIGDETCRGKSYGVEAIRLMAAYAFQGLNLHKLTAGCYASNAPSIKAFTRAGFTLECIRREHCLFEGRFEDVHLFGLINPDFCLSGGGQ